MAQSRDVLVGPISHNKVLKRLKLVGERRPSNGCCVGLTQTYLHHVLSRRELSYVDLLRHITSDSFSAEIKATKIKLKDEKYICSDKDYLNLNGYELLKMINTHQNPSRYDYIDSNLNQNNTIEISLFTVPHEIDQAGGLSKIVSHIGLHSSQQLQDYFLKLADILKTKSDRCVVMYINSFDHTVGLWYDKTNNSFIYFDANCMPAFPISIEKLTTELASYSQDPKKNVDDPAVEFCINFISTQNNSDKTLLIDELNKLHNGHMTNISLSKSPREVTILQLAIMENNVDVVLREIKHSQNVNQLDHAGYSPLHLAADRGHTECAKIILKYGGDINQTTSNGKLAAHLSIKYFRTEMVKLFALSNFDFLTPNANEKTALDYAIKYQNWHSLLIMMANLLDNHLVVIQPLMSGYQKKLLATWETLSDAEQLDIRALSEDDLLNTVKKAKTRKTMGDITNVINASTFFKQPNEPKPAEHPLSPRQSYNN